MSHQTDLHVIARLQALEKPSRPSQGFSPRLTVVGAGIGDPELLTLKALKALQSADVVLYDALVQTEILQHAPAVATKIYVGKRRGAKSYTQEEINERIVAYARCCGHVVRLKGGDPYVFGRGLEEIEYAQAHGLDASYIPGVSSAIAGAGAAGISVTLRGVSRSFWTLTATTDTGALNPEIELAARTEATVVILMGLTKLEAIAEVFKAAGKDQLPVAVVQNATLTEQQEVIGTVADIVERARNINQHDPAVIILGEVVSRRIPDLQQQALVEMLKAERLAQAEY